MYKHMRDLRDEKGLNQENIAQILSIGQSTYSDYELGKINIPIPILLHLADFYHTSVDYLLDRTDVPTPYPHSKLL